MSAGKVDVEDRGVSDSRKSVFSRRKRAVFVSAGRGVRWWVPVERKVDNQAEETGRDLDCNWAASWS